MDYQKKCKDAGLEASESFWQAKPLEIENTYNGAGPDHFPMALRLFLEKELGETDIEKLESAGRKVLTKLLELYALAFVIHDWDFKQSDGTEESFHKANDRMWQNIRILLSAKYSFWNPFSWKERAIWWGKGRAAYYACEEYGFDAWRD